MSNAKRILSNRTMLPFNHKVKLQPKEKIDAERINLHENMFMPLPEIKSPEVGPHLQKRLNINLVEQFLKDNPEFLERFLSENFTVDQLAVIFKRISHDINRNQPVHRNSQHKVSKWPLSNRGRQDSTRTSRMSAPVSMCRDNSLIKHRSDLTDGSGCGSGRRSVRLSKISVGSSSSRSRQMQRGRREDSITQGQLPCSPYLETDSSVSGSTSDTYLIGDDNNKTILKPDHKIDLSATENSTMVKVKSTPYHRILLTSLPQLSQRFSEQIMHPRSSDSAHFSYGTDYDQLPATLVHVASYASVQSNNQRSRFRINMLEDMREDLSTILDADRSFIYVVDSSGENLILSQSDGTHLLPIVDSSVLATFVASTMTSVNCHDIFLDDRFPQQGLVRDSSIRSVIAHPVILPNDELVAVIELCRVSEKPHFSSRDNEIFENYSNWAALALYYNDINIRNQKQEQLNLFILNVTQKMFGKFRNMDLIIKEIMASAKCLVKADRVSLFLVDKRSHEMYSRIFDNGNYNECIFETSDRMIKFPLGEGIAGYVAETGETLNIKDAYSDVRFNRAIDQLTGYITKSILCMPVKANEEIIGVVQMLNKPYGSFSKNDEMEFKTFAIYCGLALHIAKMYEKILRSQQKYKVALEVLSYHSGFTVEEYENLRNRSMPDRIPNLDELLFWPWKIASEDQPLHVIYMFKDLFGLELSDFDDDNIDDYKFEEDTMMRFVLTVRRNYRDVVYHNWGHAFSVAHSMYAMLKSCSHSFTLYESLAMFIGCLCHDLDHRGRTNQFMVQSSSALSVLYSTSTMEHHHFNMTVAILQRSGHNIFQRLTDQNYRCVLSNIKHCILATDLARFFETKRRLDEPGNVADFNKEQTKLNYMAVAMTMCDLCSMFKSWDMQLALVLTIMEEFWVQGDEERQKGGVPVLMMDRQSRGELPALQVGFLQGVCMPCFQLMYRVMPELKELVQSANNNLSRWEALKMMQAAERECAIDRLEQNVYLFLLKEGITFKRL